MRAIRFHQHGGVDVLKLEEDEPPELQPHEVRVRVMASGLNHMDIWVRQGLPGMAALPLVPGCDAAGVIDGVGSDVTTFKGGERVFVFPMTTCGLCRHCLSGQINLCRDFKIFGEHRQGLHRDLVCVPAANVMRLPDSVDFVGGAAFPLVFLTAWHMLFRVACVKAGDRVLIVGGASGVGSAAVQIAKALGAWVVATASGEKNLLRLKDLGADEVIDHYNENISDRIKKLTAKEGVDVIFEHVGKKVWQEVLKSLAWGGRLVTCGATSGPIVETDLRHIFIKQQQILGSTMGDHEDMRRVVALLNRGLLKPVVDRVFSPAEIKQAHEYLEKGACCGKVVLDWSK